MGTGGPTKWIFAECYALWRRLWRLAFGAPKAKPTKVVRGGRMMACSQCAFAFVILEGMYSTRAACGRSLLAQVDGNGSRLNTTSSEDDASITLLERTIHDCCLPGPRLCAWSPSPRTMTSCNPLAPATYLARCFLNSRNTPVALSAVLG